MNLNGYIMSKDKRVVEITDSEVKVLDDKLCPYLIKRLKDIDIWLENRAIDTHRPSSRILRKVLRLTTTNRIEMVLKFNAVSLTDTYWFKTKDSNLKWSEVIKAEDYFSDVIINNRIDQNSLLENLRTYELTNTGSYEKCWKKYEEDWYMIKKQSEEENISEYYSYKLGEFLGFNIAKYEILSKNLISSKNFINNYAYNFEDAFSLVDEEEDVDYNFQQLISISPKLAEGYFKMLIFDALFMNVDRHTHNYGILRDTENGELIDFAPLYDHNMCLYGSRFNMTNKSPQVFFDNIIEGKKYFSGYKLPIIYKELLDKICPDEVITNFVYNNYLELKEILK